MLARQRRGDGSGIPVQPWGWAHSGGFVAELRASNPDGTGRMKAEFEACPPGVAFGDASCASAGWKRVCFGRFGHSPDLEPGNHGSRYGSLM